MRNSQDTGVLFTSYGDTFTPYLDVIISNLKESTLFLPDSLGYLILQTIDSYHYKITHPAELAEKYAHTFWDYIFHCYLVDNLSTWAFDGAYETLESE